MKPYYADDAVTLYCGDMRVILPTLGLKPDCIVTDPPYGETSLVWDRWPDGWVQVAADVTASMWCFGSMRMFLDRRDDLAQHWRLSQDVVWEKHNGSSFAKDRFRRVHEHITHWYRGAWGEVHHETPRVPAEFDRKGRTVGRNGATCAPHAGTIGDHIYVDDGFRLVRSVVRSRSLHHAAIHPTEKPVDLLDLMIRYACPPAGLVLDPFAGSGSTAVAARMSGRRAVLIEGREDYCEAIARRLAQDVLPIGVTA